MALLLIYAGGAYGAPKACRSPSARARASAAAIAAAAAEPLLLRSSSGSIGPSASCQDGASALARRAMSDTISRGRRARRHDDEDAAVAPSFWSALLLLSPAGAKPRARTEDAVRQEDDAAPAEYVDDPDAL